MRKKSFKFTGACISDRGAVREINQDSILFRVIKGRKGSAAIGAIFDGVGGLDRGELASGLLNAELSAWINDLETRIDISETEDEILYAHLKDEAEILNDALREFMNEHRINTGSTMSLVLLVGEKFFTLNAGDSRVYLLRDELLAITTDDTIIRERDGHYKSLLSNYMGRYDEPIFSETYGTLEADDLFLFGSDGFYHRLNASDLVRLKNERLKSEEIEKELSGLIKAMIERGERDNISVGVIKVGS